MVKVRIAALMGGFLIPGALFLSILFLGGCVSPQTAAVLMKRSAAAAQLYSSVKSDTCHSLSPATKARLRDRLGTPPHSICGDGR
jgi:hypothetical protein